jgi:hypothetical protein
MENLNTCNLTKEKSFKFSIRIIKFAKHFQGKETTDYVLIKQLDRYGTSRGNIINFAKRIYNEMQIA